MMELNRLELIELESKLRKQRGYIMEDGIQTDHRGMLLASIDLITSATEL